MTDAHSILDAVVWARTLPPDALEWLKDNVREVSFAAGESLITEGATDRDCYFVVSGQAVITVGDREMGTAGPGSPIGDAGLLYRLPRQGTVTALGSVRAVVLAAEDFDRLAAEDVECARAIAEAIIEHVRLRIGRRPPPWEPLAD